MQARDVNSLLDDLAADPGIQREWELDPEAVAARYSLSDEQKDALLDGDVDALIGLGLAERHTQQMRVSW